MAKRYSIRLLFVERYWIAKRNAVKKKNVFMVYTSEMMDWDQKVKEKPYMRDPRYGKSLSANMAWQIIHIAAHVRAPKKALRRWTLKAMDPKGRKVKSFPKSV